VIKVYIAKTPKVIRSTFRRPFVCSVHLKTESFRKFAFDVQVSRGIHKFNLRCCYKKKRSKVRLKVWKSSDQKCAN